MWNNDINKHVDWGGDTNTGGEPVTGEKVQKFIKDTLNSKAGDFYLDSTANKYLIFADSEDRNKYLSDPVTYANICISKFDDPGYIKSLVSSHTHTLSSFGITASATELNYTKGVTSAIQTQLNAKASSSHTHTFASLTSKPTTLAGYGITDALRSVSLFSKADYQRYVLLLCKIGTNTTNVQHTINGTFWTVNAGNTRYQAAYINVQCADWTSGHNEFYGFTPFGMGTVPRLVTCTYNSAQYLAVTFENVQGCNVYFDGSSSNIMFTSVLYYTSNTQTVNNSEIYNSIADVQYNKIPMIPSADTVYHTGNLTKSSIGLGNVENTAFYKRSASVNGTAWDMAGTVNSSAFSIYAPTSAGTSGQVLLSTGGTPSWVDTTKIASGASCYLVPNRYPTSNTNNTAPLIWYTGQPTIGTDEGCAYKGSSNNYNLWSYPAGVTSETTTYANIQTLRLSWDRSKYWHDIFASPNGQYLWHRNVSNGSASDWHRIVEETSSNGWDISITGKVNSFRSVTAPVKNWTPTSAGWYRVAKVTIDGVDVVGNYSRYPNLTIKILGVWNATAPSNALLTFQSRHARALFTQLSGNIENIDKIRAVQTDSTNPVEYYIDIYVRIAGSACSVVFEGLGKVTPADTPTLITETVTAAHELSLGMIYGTNITDSNYNTYVPTLTGQGASGTWGINISGNAATTTKLATARTIALSGGAVSTPTAFDGSGNVSLPVTSLSADYVAWGDSNLQSNMGPIFSGLCDPLRGNRFAGIPGEDVEIEYSNDAVNYYDYGATDGQKSSFFTQFGEYLICGKNTNTTTANNNHRLRVTVTANHVYTRLDKAIIYVSTNSATNCWVKVTLSNDSTFPNNSSTLVLGTYPINGWPDYNAIPLRGYIVDPNARGGSYFKYWRFEFGSNFAGNSSGYTGLTVRGIEAYGGVGWTVPNIMAKYGRPYTYDWQGNAKFMGGITASYFSGEASSAAKLTTARTIWGQSFDGSGNVDGTLHLKASGNSYTQGIRIYQNGTGYAGILLGSTGLTATTGTDSYSWFISTNSSNNFSISKGGYSTDTTVAFGHDGGNWWLKGGNVRMPGNALYLGNSNACTIYMERPSNNYIWANQAGGTLYLGTAAGGVTAPGTAGIGIVGKQVCIGGTTLKYQTLNVQSGISIVGSTNPLIDFRNSSNTTIGYLQAVDAGWMGLGPGSDKGIFIGKDGALTINSTPPTTPTGNSIDAPGAIHSTTGLYSEGFISARGVDSSSDERLKTDIKPLENALQYVLGTKYRSFHWKEDGKQCIGVIAQEELGREHGYLVEKHKEYYSYNYAATTALIGAALQEEDRKVEALKARIAALEAEVERLRNNMYNS